MRLMVGKSSRHSISVMTIMILALIFMGNLSSPANAKPSDLRSAAAVTAPLHGSALSHFKAAILAFITAKWASIHGTEGGACN